MDGIVVASASACECEYKNEKKEWKKRKKKKKKRKESEDGRKKKMKKKRKNEKEKKNSETFLVLNELYLFDYSSSWHFFIWMCALSALFVRKVRFGHHGQRLSCQFSFMGFQPFSSEGLDSPFKYCLRMIFHGAKLFSGSQELWREPKFLHFTRNSIALPSLL